MILAAVGDTPYRIVLILHILSFMVAFAPAFVHPLVGRQSRSIDDPNFRKIVGMLAANGRKIYAPALIVTPLIISGPISGMKITVPTTASGIRAPAKLISPRAFPTINGTNGASGAIL